MSPAQNLIPNNLPLNLSIFIGRKQEIAFVIALFQAKSTSNRLLTLTGPGGVGKTRLALEVAPLLLANFEGGIWLIRLAGLSDPQLLLPTVMQAFGLRYSPESTPLLSLIEYLQNKRLLLILDNCEHLIDACAELVEKLLEACPALCILATSREGLNLAGESILPVPSLTLPKISTALEEVAETEAVQLFLQRGHAVQPNFDLTKDTAPAIIQICQRLDGLPLALELAAVQLKGLPVTQLASRLDNRFQLLTSGSRTALPRHQTLQALLDWSYNLLPQREQVLFRRLSGLVGNFSVQAAEYVCMGEYKEANGWGNLAREEILEILVQLISKSLVQFSPDQADTAEEPYYLLETLRYYAQTKAREAEETTLIRQNHLDWCILVAERAEPYLQGPEQTHWLEWLEGKQANFAVALAWASKEKPEQALRLGGALWRFWQLHSHFLEGRYWLEAAIKEANSAAVNPLVRAKALHGAGVLLSLNDYPAALAYHEENLKIRQELGDIPGQVVALKDLGWLALHYNDFARAKTFSEESLRLNELQGDKANIAASLFVLAVVAFFEEQLDESAKLDQKCLQIWREMGDSGSVASVLTHLGMIALQKTDYEEASKLLLESLNLNWELSNKLGIANTILQIIRLALAKNTQPGGTEQAVQLLGWEEQLSVAFGGKMPPLARLHFDASLTTSRARLAETSFNELWEYGRTLEITQAVQLAREVCLTPPKTMPVVTEVAQKLTQREMEVLTLVATGLTNAQVALKLSITSRTVNAHLTSIYAKLEVSSRSGAIRYALEHQLV